MVSIDSYNYQVQLDPSDITVISGNSDILGKRNLIPLKDIAVQNSDGQSDGNNKKKEIALLTMMGIGALSACGSYAALNIVPGFTGTMFAYGALALLMMIAIGGMIGLIKMDYDSTVEELESFKQSYELIPAINSSDVADMYYRVLALGNDQLIDDFREVFSPLATHNYLQCKGGSETQEQLLETTNQRLADFSQELREYEQAKNQAEKDIDKMAAKSVKEIYR